MFLLAALCIFNAAYVATAQNCKIDTLFVLDSSSSVKDGFEKQIKFIDEIADLFQIAPDQHRVAIVEYAGNSRKVLEFPWEDFPDVETFRNKVQNLPHFTGTTYTARALKTAQQVLKTRRQGVRTLVITVTDGFSFDDPTGVIEQIRQLDSDLYTFSAGVNPPLNEEDLLVLAGAEERRFMEGSAVSEARAELSKYLDCDNAPAVQTTKKTTTSAPEKETTVASKETTEKSEETTEKTESKTDAPAATTPQEEKTTPGKKTDSPVVTDDPYPAVINPTRQTDSPVVKATCDRVPYETKCSDGSNTQFTLRWFLYNGMCCTYPYGHCKLNTVSEEPVLRTKADCECECLGNC